MGEGSGQPKFPHGRCNAARRSPGLFDMSTLTAAAPVRAPRARARLALVLFLAVAIGACGGGGGGASEASTSGPLTYATQRYSSSSLVRHESIAYSVRPNPDGQLITSDLSIEADQASPQLTLRMEVTMPPDASAASPRPVLIWVHGGGLVVGNKETLRPYTTAWARAGYVTANIDYRLTPALAVNPALHTAAVLRATEDLTSAIRFLRTTAAQYAVDPARIATIGYSSAGEVVMAQAMEPQGLPGTSPDQPGVNGQVQAAISTGATLVNSFWDADALLGYQASDTPVLLMHLNPFDPVTLATWDANVLPTAGRINASGNACTVYAHTNGQHMADLNFGSPDFPVVDAFLRQHLPLP